jgi:predicted methyltransferase
MNMARSLAMFAAACAVLAVAGCAAQSAGMTAAEATALLNDGTRPEADTRRDADRKPADMVAFAGIRAGDKVVDFIPASGYFTRVFSRVVGANGTVYAFVPKEMTDRRATAADAVKAISAEPGYTNVAVLVQPAAGFVAPAPVDVVWTSQNYHDMHVERFGIPDFAGVNKAFFNALKPGGVYIVLDHAATAGSGLADTEKLHRIDPAVVKAEVTAAGFVFEGESSVLRRADDPHTAMVFDAGIRGKTDQFIYKFRKPK